MKSYIQGLLTGGILVFATIVFMGANNFKVGRYQLAMFENEVIIFDTKEGYGIKRFLFNGKYIHEGLAYHAFEADLNKEIKEVQQRAKIFQKRNKK